MPTPIHARSDPLEVRNQPALWSGRRRRWLVPAGVLGLVGVVTLAATLAFQILIPWTGIALVIGLYLGMIVCAIWVRDTHLRNLAFAWLMWAMAVVPPLALIAVAFGEAQSR